MAKKNNGIVDLEEKFGDDVRKLAFAAEVSFISDDGLMFLIEENEAKQKKLKEQNIMLREELVRRANGKKE